MCPPRRFDAKTDNHQKDGSDDEDVLGMIQLVGGMWAEEVNRVGAKSEGVRLRPGFHSWLYNIEMGKQTAATPDGRFFGEPLSSDHLPSPGKGGVSRQA